MRKNTKEKIKDLIRQHHNNDRAWANTYYALYKQVGGKLTYRSIIQSDPNFKQSYRKN